MDKLMIARHLEKCANFASPDEQVTRPSIAALTSRHRASAQNTPRYYEYDDSLYKNTRSSNMPQQSVGE